MSTSGRWIVLDTGALIAGSENLYALGGITDGNNKNAQLQSPSGEPAHFFVTPDVLAETRDARARARLASLERLGCVTARAPSSEAVQEVIAAAKKTGDFAVLSMADLKVLALTLMLDVERNGRAFLKDVQVAQLLGEVRRAPGVSFAEVEKWEKEEEDRKAKERAAWDGWTTVEKKNTKPQTKKKKRGRKKKKNVDKNNTSNENKQATQTEPQVTQTPSDFVASVDQIADVTVDNKHQELIPEAAIGDKSDPALGFDQLLLGDRPISGKESKLSRVPSALIEENQLQELSRSEPEEYGVKTNGVLHIQDLPDETEDLSEDDDGIGWINNDNLEEHLARDGGEETLNQEDGLRVACVTTDFAMQNTMLQMGLKLLSVDGRRTIRQIRRFALRCQSCSHVTRDLQRKFCEKCGNASLHRVAFKVNKQGVARVFLNPKKKPILRGTKYSIPMPRGGRHNKDLILCEDQIDPVKQRRLEKQRQRMNVDVLDPSMFYNAGAKFNPHDKPLVIGYGKRNPNEVRRSSKSKR